MSFFKYVTSSTFFFIDDNPQLIKDTDTEGVWKASVYKWQWNVLKKRYRVYLFDISCM